MKSIKMRFALASARGSGRAGRRIDRVDRPTIEFVKIVTS